jgi:hypothetical protein
MMPASAMIMSRAAPWLQAMYFVLEVGFSRISAVYARRCPAPE